MLYLSPVGNSQQVASNGAPLVGGKIYTYLAGSTTPAATYTDNTGSTPQANPIILDSNGLPLSPMWLQGGVSYKLVIQTAAGVTMRTVDNVSGINDTTNTQNEWVDSGLTPTYISGTSFSLVGDQRAIFQQYRRVKTQNTSGTVYGTVSSSTYSLGVTTIIVANDGTSALDSGLSSVAYGFMSATNPSIPVLFLTNTDEQKQTFTAFTTAGTAPAYTLTPSPAITAYTAGLRFRVKFHAAGAAGNMAISSLPAKTLKQFAYDGTKIAATITADMLADVEYDGTDLIILNPLPPSASGIQGGVKNLSISTTGSSATITASCDEIFVENATNNYGVILRSVSLSINSASSGGNGLDTGSLAINTWYSVWVIYNPTTGGVTGLISTSATAPTLPSGFTFKARIGWIRTDSTGSKFPLAFKQAGKTAQYVIAGNVAAYPVMANTPTGTMGVSSSTLAAVSVSAFVPSTASTIRLSYFMYSSVEDALAINPNNSVTAGSRSKTNQAQVMCGSNQNANGGIADMVLESTNIYYAGSNNATLNCVGWTDNL